MTLRKQLMRVRDAAEYLGLAPSTLAKMRVRGDGCPYSKAGRVVLYDVEDLNRWLAAKKRSSTSDSGIRRDAPEALQTSL